MSEYFLKPKSLGANVKVELDLPTYATKADFKKMRQVLIQRILLKKTNLANLKSDVDKLDIDKLKNLLIYAIWKVEKLDLDKLVPVPVDLSKLSDVVKNDVVKKDVYNAKIKNIEDKIPDITNLATNTTLNAKTNVVKTNCLTLLT